MEKMKLKNKEQLAWVSSQEEECCPFERCADLRFKLLPFEYCENWDFVSANRDVNKLSSPLLNS